MSRPRQDIKAEAANFLSVLASARLPENSAHSKFAKGRSGRAVVFGMAPNRKASKVGPSRVGGKHPELFGALMLYLRALLPEEEIAKYDSIYIAVDAATDWHCDKKNIGRSIVTALGDYTGGEFLMKTTRRLFQCQKCLKGRKGPEFCRKEELHSDPDGVYA